MDPSSSPATTGMDIIGNDRSLEERLAEAHAALRALADGEVDAILDPTTATPILLAKARDALRESEERYRRIFETANEGIWVADPTGKIVIANKRLADLLDCTVDDLHKAYSYQFIFSEDMEITRTYLERRRQGIREDFDFRLRRHNGAELWAHVSASPILDSRGKLAGTLAMFTDISDRMRSDLALRQREERFRLLIERTADVMSILTPDGTVQYASPSVEKVLGYEPSSWIGTNPFTFVHPEDHGVSTSTWALVVQNPGQAYTNYCRCRHRDGAWRLVESVSINLVDEPAIAGIVTTFRDVTERRRLEEQLRQAQKMEAVGQLAGGVAHDFNNLLTVIIGFAELVHGRTATGSFEREALDEILKASESASSLTRQLLAFSRRQEITPKPIDLNRVVRRLEKLLHRLIGEDITLAARLAADLGLVLADEGQIEQILMNLAANARDAMPDGGELAFETANVDLDASFASQHAGVKAGPHVRLIVRDTGVGMDAVTQTRIFEPFFTTKDVGQGTGLGLAAVYGIVKQSDGSIYVDSSPGRGTAFAIYLPRLASAAVATGATNAGTPTLTGVETILLVEDESQVRALARLVLEASGYTILEASNGREAEQIAEQHPGPIHLLFTDVVMPGLNGSQVAERVRQKRPNVKVLFVSGYTKEQLDRRGVNDAASDFLQKPYTPSVLNAKIRQILDRDSRGPE